MDEEEFEWRKRQIQRNIDFNHRIKCHLVAARYERELKQLEKYYEQHKDEHQPAII